MAPQRQTARNPRPAIAPSLLGRIQVAVYRHRWVRWVVACAAAVAVLMALNSDRCPEPPVTATPQASTGTALLPAETRGVPVPIDSDAFTVGDSVDVHAVLDGAAVVRAAPIVEQRADEVVVAVPAEQVDATVDALTTGGVILVLVPA